MTFSARHGTHTHIHERARSGTRALSHHTSSACSFRLCFDCRRTATPADVNRFTFFGMFISISIFWGGRSFIQPLTYDFNQFFFFDFCFYFPFGSTARDHSIGDYVQTNVRGPGCKPHRSRKSAGRISKQPGRTAQMSAVAGSRRIVVFTIAGRHHIDQIDIEKCPRTLDPGDCRHTKLHSELFGDATESGEFRHTSVGHRFSENHQIRLVLFVQRGNGVPQHCRRCAEILAGESLTLSMQSISAG